MSQSVGELFISLGIKGGNEAFKALSSIKNAVTDMSAAGIAAKASILGAVYALEQWTSQSASYGNNLTNFATLTGIATTKQQQLAEAIRQSTHVTPGEATSEAQSFLKNFQSKSAAWQTEGRVHGSQVARFVHETGWDLNDPDPFHFFAALQKLSNSKIPINQLNHMFESMNIGGLIVDASRKFKGNPLDIKANIESPWTVARNDAVAGQWSDFEKRVARVRDQLTAKWGLPVIEELNKGLTILEAWEKKIENIRGKKTTALLQEFWDDWQKHPDSKHVDNQKEYEARKGNAPKFDPSMVGSPVLPNNATDALGLTIMKAIKDFMMSPQGIKSIWPTKEDFQKDKGHTSINVHVNQHGVKDTTDGLEAHKNEVARAYYSIPSIGQVV